MHSFSHHSNDEASSKETKGLILSGGWRYDLHVWFTDTFSFRGKVRELRQRVVNLARVQPGEQVLDVGCGTGTLAMTVARRVGRAGHVAGIDPAAEQIARARTKATRRRVLIDFQIGVIEHLPFPDQTFDVAFSTLMMHHLPAPLKRQGIAEIARVLKPGGRLVIADFTRKRERQGQAARFHAGGSNMNDLVTLIKEAGFDQVKTEEMQPARFSAFPGAGFVLAYKSRRDCASRGVAGARAKYIDLQPLEQGEFVALADMVADEDYYYVPKKHTEYVLWNRLNEVSNPSRLDE